jgi:hypothetical protein
VPTLGRELRGRDDALEVVFDGVMLWFKSILDHVIIERYLKAGLESHPGAALGREREEAEACNRAKTKF